MVVRYLKDGEDFGARHFSEVSPAFSGSARMPKGQPPMQDAKGGSIKSKAPTYPRTGDAKGGALRRGVGGTMAQPGDIDADDTYSSDHRKAGGRIRRASGGTIPGPAPAASAQPLTATATPAPNSGQQTNPLANATVSMPATDMAALTSKAVKMGAGAALSAIAQRNKAHGQVGAGGTAPAAAAPAGLSQSNPQPGIQGMATGGHINIKPSHRGLLHKDLGVPAGKPISQAKMDSAKAGASPAERKRITFAENARHWNKG